MNDVPCPTMAYPAHLTLFERTTAWGAWALGGAIFLTVGWMAVQPDDPLGPVSMLSRHHSLAMLVQAGALAVVATALGAAMAGRVRTDVGTFAAVLGLAAVSLRGGTAGQLLVEYAEFSEKFERGLALKLALESVGWFAVVLLSLLVSGVVTRWCHLDSGGRETPGEDSPAPPAPLPAACDWPALGVRWLGISGASRTTPLDGMKHMATAACVGLAAMSFFSAGLSSRAIQHGQVFFVVAASVSLGVYFAYRFVPVRSALWAVLAVPAIALVGYLWASVRPSVLGLPVTIPSSHFLRILPVQFLSVGTAAALAMFWHMYTPADHEDTRRQTRRGDAHSRGRT